MDDLRAALLKLRIGSGVTPARLAQVPAVMSALGSANPTVALQRLIAAIDELGERIDVAVLKNAYGIGTKGRNLTERQANFSTLVQRMDMKTLRKKEVESIDELAVLIETGRNANAAYRAVLFVEVVAGRTQRIVATLQETDDPSDAASRTVTMLEHVNPNRGRSVNLFVYQLPTDWPKLTSVFVTVHFKTAPFPASGFGTRFLHLYELGFHGPTIRQQEAALTAAPDGKGRFLTWSYWNDDEPADVPLVHPYYAGFWNLEEA